MVRTAYLDRKGTTLVEVLISLLLTAVVFAALVQTALLAVNKNVENLMRDEAVSIAEMRMNQARNSPFGALISDAAPVPVTRDFRGVTGFPFNTQMTVTALGADNRQVTITVTWTRRGANYTHTITTVVRRS